MRVKNRARARVRFGKDSADSESAAVLDVCRKLNLLPTTSTDDNKALLERIAQMLTKLIKSRRPTA